jgi:hypothetical protein
VTFGKVIALHYLLVQFRVFRNVPFNAIAIGLYFSSQRLKPLMRLSISPIEGFDTWRSKLPRFLGRRFAIATLDLPKASASACKFGNVSPDF